MASNELMEAAEEFARGIKAVLWSGVPIGGTSIGWRGDNVLDFFRNVSPLRPRIVYVSADEDIVAVSVEGVLHVYGAATWSNEEEPGYIAVTLSSAYQGSRLSEDLQALAETIANDVAYDHRDPEGIVSERAAHLTGKDYSDLEREVTDRFTDGADKVLAREASALVRELLKHPDFDPLSLGYAYGSADSDFINFALIGKDPRLKERVERGLLTAAMTKGFIKRAEQEVRAVAAATLEVLSVSDRDRLGFATRNHPRDELLLPYLESVPERRRDRVGNEMRQLEYERFGALREARYATAARILLSRKLSMKAVALKLHIGTSTIDRLLSTRRENVLLEPEDPLQIELGSDSD
jgi:hypothetical protein